MCVSDTSTTGNPPSVGAWAGAWAGAWVGAWIGAWVGAWAGAWAGAGAGEGTSWPVAPKPEPGITGNVSTLHGACQGLDGDSGQPDSCTRLSPDLATKPIVHANAHI